MHTLKTTTIAAFMLAQGFGINTGWAKCGAPQGSLQARDITAQQSFSVGDFSITLDSDLSLNVTHAEAPGRTLFETATRRPLISAAQASLEVEDNQSSYEIDESISITCDQPVLGALDVGSDVAVLSGRFSNTSASCQELTWELRFCQETPQQLSFTVVTSDSRFNKLSVSIASDRNERIYGMGEQFPHNSLDLKGRKIPVLTQEGGIGRGQVPITGLVNLVSRGSGGNEEATYYAAAHFLTSELKSVFLENVEYAVFDFSRRNLITMELYASELHGRILTGNSPLELIENFSQYAGRMPALPEWVHNGAIVALARGTEESLDIINRLEAGGVELAGVWNQTWSGRANTFIGEQVLWNWTKNEVFHPEWDNFVDTLNQKNIRVLCYLNPMLTDPFALENSGDVEGDLLFDRSKNLFKEAMDNDYFIKTQSGSPYIFRVTAFDVGMFDFTNPEARTWIKSKIIKEGLLESGCSGWMADFAEALPFDALTSTGISGEAYHNQYPVDWAEINREALEEFDLLGEVLTFSRSGHTTSPRHGILFWEGDQTVTWDRFDGLTSAIHGLLNGGFSGISLNHSDVGGYTALIRLDIGFRREAELLKRWTEMNAFTAMLRTHEGNEPNRQEQIYSDDELIAHFGRFSKVYKALGFYRKKLFQEASQRGWPVVRHLWLEYPNDATAQTIDNQFMLGSEFLVAPIQNRCLTRPICPYNKSVYLPPGQWVHLWSGQIYGNTSEGTRIRVKSPIGEPAVFYPLGSDVAATFRNNLEDLGISTPSTPPLAPGSTN